MTNLTPSLNDQTAFRILSRPEGNAASAGRPRRSLSADSTNHPLGHGVMPPCDPLAPFGNDPLADVLALSRDGARPIDASPLLLRFEHFDITIRPVGTSEIELRVGAVETKRAASPSRTIAHDTAPGAVGPTWETQSAFADVMGQSIIRIEQASSDALLIAFDCVTMRIANKNDCLQVYLIRSWPYDSSSSLRK